MLMMHDVCIFVKHLRFSGKFRKTVCHFKSLLQTIKCVARPTGQTGSNPELKLIAYYRVLRGYDARFFQFLKPTSVFWKNPGKSHSLKIVTLT